MEITADKQELEEVSIFHYDSELMLRPSRICYLSFILKEIRQILISRHIMIGRWLSRRGVDGWAWLDRRVPEVEILLPPSGKDFPVRPRSSLAVQSILAV